MAQREQMGENISPGVIERIKLGVKYAITGVGPTNFFGPAQPIQPIAQAETEGRAFDFPVGINLRIQPREGENISFAQLRALADNYDLMRLVIETRKDQIKSYDWEIVPFDQEVDAETMKEQIAKAREFFESPDKEHDFDDWISMFVEDLLVIDAVCVYPRQTRGGGLYALELVDGSTIKRLLDDSGRTPIPPSPAYQQIIKGIPAGDYSRDTLLYMMRNPRTNRVYGYSPVEQVIMTVNIALRRQMTQMSFYTEGNIPEAIAQAPETWTPKQLADFQTWWDSVNEGVAAQKRRMTFIPSLKDIVFPRQEVLKDEFDEWLARIICFAFSIPPTAFIKQMNRATAEQSDESAKEEGLKPLLRWLEAKLTYMLRRYAGFPELKFSWKMAEDIDPKVQADIHAVYINAKVLTPDEVRADLGRDPMSDADREKYFPEPPNPLEMGGLPGQPGKKPGEEGEGAPQAKDGEKPVDGEEKPPVEEKKVEKAANVVELRPEFRFDIGDTRPRAPAGKVIKAERLPDGSMIARWVDDPMLKSSPDNQQATA